MKIQAREGLVRLHPEESCWALAELFLLLFLTWCQTPGSSPHCQGAGICGPVTFHKEARKLWLPSAS